MLEMPEKTMTINIAKDFSRTPGVRYEWQGPFSGATFRDKILHPMMEHNPDAVIQVVLDGTAGYSTSFLEEAFGGLAREIGSQRCLEKIRFISKDDPFIVEEIVGFIQNASNSANKKG